ncbi:MAG: hypothetical protein EYC67_12970 [Betaproteobacteria bacterium]|nr:MAG: hypothetical protein EYC67_12970 [Betaproteobacteria bacterium]
MRYPKILLATLLAGAATVAVAEPDRSTPVKDATSAASAEGKAPPAQPVSRHSHAAEKLGFPLTQKDSKSGQAKAGTTDNERSMRHDHVRDMK